MANKMYYEYMITNQLKKKKEKYGSILGKKEDNESFYDEIETLNALRPTSLHLQKRYNNHFFVDEDYRDVVTDIDDKSFKLHYQNLTISHLPFIALKQEANYRIKKYQLDEMINAKKVVIAAQQVEDTYNYGGYIYDILMLAPELYEKKDFDYTDMNLPCLYSLLCTYNPRINDYNIAVRAIPGGCHNTPVLLFDVNYSRKKGRFLFERCPEELLYPVALYKDDSELFDAKLSGFKEKEIDESYTDTSQAVLNVLDSINAEYVLKEQKNYSIRQLSQLLTNNTGLFVKDDTIIEPINKNEVESNVDGENSQDTSSAVFF